jgi:hypothetical protein
MDSWYVTNIATTIILPTNSFSKSGTTEENESSVILGLTSLRHRYLMLPLDYTAAHQELSTRGWVQSKTTSVFDCSPGTCGIIIHPRLRIVLTWAEGLIGSSLFES